MIFFQILKFISKKENIKLTKIILFCKITTIIFKCSHFKNINNANRQWVYLKGRKGIQLFIQMHYLISHFTNLSIISFRKVTYHYKIFCRNCITLISKRNNKSKLNCIFPKRISYWIANLSQHILFTIAWWICYGKVLEYSSDLGKFRQKPRKYEIW